MAKLIKLNQYKSILPWVLIFLFTSLPAPSNAEVKISDPVSALEEGHYSEAIELAQKLVIEFDSKKKWRTPFSRADYIATFGRYAALFGHDEGQLWARDNLQKYLDRNDIAYDYRMNIALRSDAIQINNPSAPIDARINILRSFAKINVISHLTDQQAVLLFSDFSRVSNEFGDPKDAERFAHQAVATAASSINVDPVATALAVSNLAYIYGSSGRTKILPELLLAIGELENKGVFPPFHPDAFLTYSYIAQINFGAAPLRETIKFIDRIFESFSNNNVEVPIWSKILTFVTELYAKSMIGEQAISEYGAAKYQELFGKNISDNRIFEMILRYAEIHSKIAKGVSVSKEEARFLKTKPLPQFEGVRLLGLFQHTISEARGEVEVSNIIDEIVDNLASTTEKATGKLTYQRQASTLDFYTQEVIFRNIYKLYGEDVPHRVSGSLFNLVNKLTALKSDYLIRTQTEAQNASDPEVSIDLRRLLKFAEEREQLSLFLAERAVKNSIEYVQRNFKYSTSTDKQQRTVGFDYIRLGTELGDILDRLNDYDKKLVERIGYPDVNLSDLAKVLKKNELYYQYEASENFSFYCYAYNEATKCGLRPIDHKKIFENIKFLRSNITGSSHLPDSYPHKQSYDLFGDIFGNVLRNKNISKLYFKPWGQHLTVPFHALTISDEKGEKFLGLEMPIRVVPSFAAMFVKARNKHVGTDKKYLGIADPEYQKIEVSEVNVDSLFSVVRSGIGADELSSLANLPSTKIEVIEASSDLPDTQKTLLIGADATELNVRKLDLGTYKVIHFATHGLVSGEFSGLRQPALALSVPAGNPEPYKDGILDANEIAEFDLNSDLVVLSACQTATDYGKPNVSGFNGLTTAFMAAGAKSVLGSQWKVESKSAARLIAFTTNQVVADNELPEIALMKAMRKISSEEEFRHPYFWAPFIVTGGKSSQTKSRLPSKINIVAHKKITHSGGGLEVLSIETGQRKFSGTGYQFLDGASTATNFIYSVDDNLNFKKTELPYKGISPLTNISGTSYYKAYKDTPHGRAAAFLIKEVSGKFTEHSEYIFKGFTHSGIIAFRKTNNGYVALLEGIEKADGSGAWLFDVLHFSEELKLEERININYIKNQTGLIGFYPKLMVINGMTFLAVTTSENPSKGPFSEDSPEPSMKLPSSETNKYNFTTGRFECRLSTDTHIFELDEDANKFEYSKFLPRTRLLKQMEDDSSLFLAEDACLSKHLMGLFVQDLLLGEKHHVRSKTFRRSVNSIIKLGKKGWLILGAVKYDISSLNQFGQQKLRSGKFRLLNRDAFFGSNTARARELMLLNDNFEFVESKLVPNRDITFYGPGIQADTNTVITFGVDGSGRTFLEKIRINQ
jgi:CHAT domain-containing protein